MSPNVEMMCNEILVFATTAIKVTDNEIEVISEGRWKLFTPDQTTVNEILQKRPNVILLA
jgi:hypothetical protein